MGLVLIPQEHADKVCKIGQGAEYCIYPVVGGNGIECARNTELKAVLDAKADRNEMVATVRGGEDCVLWQA